MSAPEFKIRWGYGRELVARDLDFSCVYVITHTRGKPTKVGIARNVASRLSQIASSTPEDVYLHEVFWLPGKPVSLRVEKAVHAILDKGGARIKGEWFDVLPELASETIRHVVEKERFPALSAEQYEQALIDHQAHMMRRRGEVNNKMLKTRLGYARNHYLR